MTEPTKEQIKELWKWCGIEERLESDTGVWYYHYPNHVSDIELPPIDLNNLFKYAAPKLKKEYRNWKSVLHDWIDGLTEDPEKDALSLFWLLNDHFGLMEQPIKHLGK